MDEVSHDETAWEEVSNLKLTTNEAPSTTTEMKIDAATAVFAQEIAEKSKTIKDIEGIKMTSNLDI